MLVNGELEQGIFTLELRGKLIETSVTPLVTLYVNNQEYLGLAITIIELEMGLYSYSFTCPNDWQFDDNITFLVRYSIGTKNYSQLLRIGRVKYDLRTLDLLGYSSNLQLCIDGNTGRTELPDGRGFVKSVDALDDKIRYITRVDE